MPTRYSRRRPAAAPPAAPAPVACAPAVLGVRVLSVCVLAACALAACASNPSQGTEALRDPAAGAQGVTRIEGTTGTTEIRTVNSAAAGVETPIRADADKAFGQLQGVYEGLGLKINTVLSDSRTLGVRSARAPRRVGGQPLSRMIECGNDAAGMANADAYAVTFTTLSRVTVVGPGSSMLVTQVAASAKPMSTSGSEVRCSSNGRLEQMINDAVAARATP